ncbi:MAG: hypothetical protein NC301_05030 [Bacteroides sp.]|nr:hypothetical protein [Bacteroides sp.]MCM1379799.1 hypothetical protein [Bacteroides sp.]MCM1446158.1 hypothetical protein [Prevotella sp.]
MKRLNIIAAILATAATVWAGPVQVTAVLDSVDVMQGGLRKVEVDVVQPQGLVLRWLSDPIDSARRVVEIYPGVEVNYSSRVDTNNLGNDRLQLRRTLLIQPWDSGEVVVPGIALVSGMDTFRSAPFALKVYTADVDTMTTVHAMMPEATQSRHFWDWLPDAIYYYWWAFLLGLLAIAGCVAAYILHRKGGLQKMLAKPEVIVPPYEKAIAELQNLKVRQLCEKGREKEYYTELTEILRQYLEGRFGINAMEMTTPQIKRAVYATVPEKSASTMMTEILEMADYVKFARMRPLPEDNVRAFNQAIQFVENTKPEPEPIEGKEAKR